MKPATFILEKLRAIKARDGVGNGEARNILARELFASKPNREIQGPDGSTVETYWDGSTKNWVTQTRDSAGDQIGDADYNGNKDDAAIAHAWALFRFLKTPLQLQWDTLKKECGKDTLLLVRLGDFYEAFNDDAARLGAALTVAITNRQGVPMAGIPAHSLTKYLEQLRVREIPFALAEAAEPRTPGIPSKWEIV